MHEVLALPEKKHLVSMPFQHSELHHSKHSLLSSPAAPSEEAKKLNGRYKSSKNRVRACKVIKRYYSKKEKHALTGNRTRASRVAGENSTTEPSVRLRRKSQKQQFYLFASCAGDIFLERYNLWNRLDGNQINSDHYTGDWRKLCSDLQPTSRSRTQVNKNAGILQELILPVELDQLERGPRAVPSLLRKVVELVLASLP